MISITSPAFVFFLDKDFKSLPNLNNKKRQNSYT
jgi:hypothetical protein